MNRYKKRNHIQDRNIKGNEDVKADKKKVLRLLFNEDGRLQLHSGAYMPKTIQPDMEQLKKHDRGTVGTLNPGGSTCLEREDC